MSIKCCFCISYPFIWWLTKLIQFLEFSFEYIFNKIITDIDKNISELSKLYYDIALECKQKYYIPNTDITRAKKLRKYQILYRNSFIITSVILKDEDTSIANLKKC